MPRSWMALAALVLVGASIPASVAAAPSPDTKIVITSARIAGGPEGNLTLGWVAGGQYHALVDNFVTATLPAELSRRTTFQLNPTLYASLQFYLLDSGCNIYYLTAGSPDYVTLVDTRGAGETWFFADGLHPSCSDKFSDREPSSSSFDALLTFVTR